ncbi:MAG: hypothetical protein R3249_02620 [Nitriliruptorales bacterium]|nr:hypothetical protein [Nitriliruptorales bacterium]
MSLGAQLYVLARGVAGSTRNHGQAVELSRLGRVQDMAAGRGELRCTIRRPAGRTDVRMTAPPVSDDAIERLVAALADSVEHVATLVGGDLPPASVVAELLGEPLVPDWADVAWSPDDPVLAAALLVRLGSGGDGGLELLLAWRGIPADRLLADVRARRSPSDELVAGAAVDDPTAAPGGPPRAVVTIAPPVEPEALVRSLGPVPAPGIIEAVREAAEFAWRVAAGAGNEAASESVLLAELRGLGTATAEELATRLGIAIESAEQVLAGLHADGQVLRAGDRFRAA